MAIAENHLEAIFNKPDFNVIDHFTYVMCGDGDLQEGIAMEAVSLAGHLGLSKLIVLYDSNDIQLDGEVALANTENTKMKFESMNWDYQLVKDGNDIDALNAAIEKAKVSGKPSIIEIKTVIGYGAPNSGESSIHGKPMSSEALAELRRNLGYTIQPFTIDDEVYDFYKKNVAERGYNACTVWNKTLNDYSNKYDEDFKLFNDIMYDDVKVPSYKELPQYEVGSSESTRKVMGKIVDYLSSRMPNILGGSADLTASTMVKGADGIFGEANPLGRNIKFL